MKKHTSFKIGGNADLFVKVKKIDEIKYILEFVNKNKVKLTVIGNGSNILVTDKGIRGIVMKIDLQGIDIQKKVEDNVVQLQDKMVAEETVNYNYNQAIVTVGAGVKLGKLAQILLKEGIEGFEFASGIPGSCGGAIRMNAGAYGKEMKDVVLETIYIDREGNLHTVKNNEQEFSYRKSMFSEHEYIILSTKLILNYGIKEQIKAKMDEYAASRKEKQPIEFPSAGSTFKRGEDFITAKLIDECGLKGYRIGNAEVSKKHAGFIINIGDATAQDVMDLIEYVKKQIYEKTNKKIELEIRNNWRKIK